MVGLGEGADRFSSREEQEGCKASSARMQNIIGDVRETARPIDLAGLSDRLHRLV
jgi:hypothetical protein